MYKWRFRIPREGEEQRTTAREYVERLWPEGTAEQVRKLFAEGRVESDGILITRQDRPLPADTLVDVEAIEEGREVFGLPDAEALLWGQGWVIVDKPIGIPGKLRGDDPMDPIRFMADMLGIDREGFRPAWEMPAMAGGPWIMGRSPEKAREVAEGILKNEIQTTWLAIVVRPAQGRGTWETSRGKLDYAVTRTLEDLAEIQITPRWNSSESEQGPFFDLLAIMAESGNPVLGDAQNGGYLVAGGLRLRLGAVFGNEEFAHSWPSPREWWPEEPVVAPREQAAAQEEGGESRGRGKVVREVGELEVSRQTLEVLESQGHPWVLRDDRTGSIDSFEPADPVRLLGPKGESDFYAIVDGTGPVVARLWSREKEAAENFDEELEIRLDEAIVARGELFRNLDKTDVFRIVHAEADGMPGMWIDQLGPLIRVTTLGRCALGYREGIYELLRRRDPVAMILEVEHLRDLRSSDELPRARVVHEGARFLRPGDDLIVHEAGLRYRVEPWEGIDVGFFADQRENRRRALERARPGQRWLNLFCHTGAFSVALANAGVHTTNVDLSKRYLRWLDMNFELNGLDLELRQNVDDDARRYLKSAKGPFDGIIVDPPTAAASDAGFWSVRDDYEALLTSCFEVLAPGGSMLICRNERRKTASLVALAKRAAKAAGHKVSDVVEVGPARDYPRLDGFFEGDTFEGVWVS